MDKNLRKFLQCFGVVLGVIIVLQLSGKEIPIIGSFIDSMGATDSNFTYEIKGKSVYIKGYKGKSSKVDIPEKIDGVPVRVISEGAFNEKSNIKELSLPSTISDIEDKAFSCCTSLVQINVPENVKKIGDEAFFNCTSLSSVKLPSTLNSIGVNAFASTAIGSVTIPDTVRNIGTYAFANCYSLRKVVLPGSLNKVEDNAFYGCTSLKQVDIPGSVSSIGNMAFSNCTSLNKVTIPSSVKRIGQYAFEDCSALTKADMPDTIEKVGAYAFSGCASLSDIHISKKLDNISEGTFSGCKSIETVNIPENITQINNNAFSSCANIREIDIPSSVKNIGNKAFLSCKRLQSVNIASGVSSIGDTAFMECKSLSKLTIGGKLNSIGELAFYKCSSLKNILFLGDAPNKVLDGAFEMIDEHGTLIVPVGKSENYKQVIKEGKNLTNGVTIVEGNSFDNAVKKDSLDEKESVTGDAERKDEDNKEEVSETKDDKKYDSSTDDEQDQKSTCTVRYINSDGSVISKEDVEYNSVVTLSKEPKQSTGIFVGWAANIGSKKILCMENSEYVIDKDIDFKAVWVNLYMLDGASVRLSNPTGIRFSSRIDKDDYDNINTYANEIEFGTVICPTSYLDDVTVFSTKKLSAADKKFLDIPVKVWYTSNSKYKEFTGVMINVKEKNYAKDFSARSYINVTYWDGRECRFYNTFSKDRNSRSICRVAESAINDSSSYSSLQIDMLKRFVNISKQTLNR